MSDYRLVLGLEIHMHVKTLKKMFCRCDAYIYDSAPNTHTCPVCLGLPGALPVPNFDAVKKTQMLGLAIGCELNPHSYFDRKHYFYPDLPKGYQISQYKQPFCLGIDGTIERIHLEEDTAKSFHEGESTLIDFNKSGMPLIEIVTKPVFTSAQEASDFARVLRDTAKYLGVSDCDMEKGQMRIEPNISVRTIEMENRNELPNYKVEVKNINSFKYMEKAVAYEFERQVKLLESGQKPVQENRGYNETKNITVSQRVKEEAKDYRYFPDPDIPPLSFDDDYLTNLRNSLPELLSAKKQRYIEKLGLTENAAEQLTTGFGIDLIEKFEALEKAAAGEYSASKIANLLLNRNDYRYLTVEEFLEKLTEVTAVVDDKDQLKSVVSEVLAENPDAVAKIKAGKDSVMQFLIGQGMRKTQGKADKDILITLIKQEVGL